MKNKIVFLPYDFDTALGTNNEGSLQYEYNLEDTDYVDGGTVFTGQNSLLWNNFRDAFGSRIRTMYGNLRANNVLSYETVEKMFEDHQNMWPEALFNEDSYFKYLQPLIQEGSNYLPALQGNKKHQRRRWLYNRFRYMDSKWNTGDALKSVITLRCYDLDEKLKITPFADIYPTVKWSSVYTSARGARGEVTEFECPLDNVNDTEVYIYSASQISSVGDLSGFKVGLADFSAATNLQEVILGSGKSGYINQSRFESLTFGNNTKLEKVDIRNCVNVNSFISMKNCIALTEGYFEGSSITGVQLPNGTRIQKLHLPATVTSLELRNAKNISELQIANGATISSLRIENPNAYLNGLAMTMLRSMPADSRVRFIGLNAEFASLEDVNAFYDMLDTMRGIDESEEGLTLPKAAVSGTIKIPSCTSIEERALRARYADIDIIADDYKYAAYFYDGTNRTPIYSVLITPGTPIADPVETGAIERPTKAATATTGYSFNGWDTELVAIEDDMNITAIYNEVALHTVRFVDHDGTLLDSQTVADGEDAVDPITSGRIETPTRETDENGAYTFDGWTGGSMTNVTNNRTLTAHYAVTEVRTVTFVNDDNTLLYKAYVTVGGSVEDPLTSGAISTPSKPENITTQIAYTYAGWDKTFSNVTENITVKATYTEHPYYFATFIDGDNEQFTKTRYDAGERVVDPVITMGNPTKTYVKKYIISGSFTPGWCDKTGTDYSEEKDDTHFYRQAENTFDLSGTSPCKQIIVNTDKYVRVWFYNKNDRQVRLNETERPVGAASFTVNVPNDADVYVFVFEDGASVTAKFIPTYNFVYKGWDKTLASSILANTTYTAQFKTDQTFTVNFRNYDDSIIATMYVADEDDAEYTVSNPTRPVDNYYTYTFLGWNTDSSASVADANALLNVTANRDIYAIYSKTDRLYTVIFRVEGVDKQTTQVRYGQSATYSEGTPTSSNPDLQFTKWSPEPTNITADTVCIAQFIDTASKVLKYLTGKLVDYSSDTNATVADYGLAYQQQLKTVTAPLSSIASNSFKNSANIEKIELTSSSPVTIPAVAFSNFTKLTAVIIRSTEMSALANVNAFTSTPIARLAGAIYVPFNLVSTYRSDAMWKHFYIASVDDYPVTNFSTITEDLDTLIANIKSGSVSQYKLGDTKYIGKVNNVDTYMQLVGFNQDTTAADATVKAKTSWIVKNLCGTAPMNSTNTSVGGWAECALRKTTLPTILAALPENLRNAIVPVTKTYYDGATYSVLSTTDSLWIPSYYEMYGNTTLNGNAMEAPNGGALYTEFFNSNETHVKYNEATAANWWLRSSRPGVATDFVAVGSNGYSSFNVASNSYGLAFGFAI